MEQCGSGLEVIATPAKRKIQRNRRQLTLAQRVAVIERYEQKASVRALAVRFNCGRTQIKGILRNRNLHFAAYQRSQQLQLGKEPQTKHVLEFVLNECVQRALCYEISITDKILMKFARDIADRLGAKTLMLNEKWLAAFKRSCKLTDKDLLSPALRERCARMGAERKSLSIDVIVQDLRQQYGADKIPWIESIDAAPLQAEVSESVDDLSMSGGDDDSVQVIPLIKEEGFGVQVETEVPIKEISSFKEALNHLGPLEQFALMQENIRAIGLINQLENLFRDQMAETT